MSGFVRVCGVEDLGDDTAKRVEVGGHPICLARSGGRFYAVGDVCSHAEVSLSDGEVTDSTVECYLHGSCFDLASGKPTGLPATKPVPTYAVKIEGDAVLVSVD